MNEREKMECLLLSQCEPEDIVNYFYNVKENKF